jgi:hypothetical protein
MAAATYDQKPSFLVKELDKILREKGRKANAAQVGRKIPVVRIQGGRVEIVRPSVGPSSKR